MSMTNDPTEFLQEQCQALEERLAERTRQYQGALRVIDKLEKVTSASARLATQIAYLVSTLPERSTDVEQAADQLRALLTSRQT